MRIGTFIPGICGLVLSATVAASEPPRLTTEDELAVRMVELSGALEIAEDMARQMAASIVGPMRAEHAGCDAMAPALDSLEGGLAGGMREIMESPALMADMAAIYADLFTETELRELIAFQETPVGRKFVAVGPEVTRRTMEASQRHAQAMIPEFEKSFAAFSVASRAALEQCGAAPVKD